MELRNFFQSRKKMSVNTVETVVLALLASLMLLVQVVLSPLPNVELVSLLCIVYTLVFRKKTIFIIAVFVLIEGLIYGFAMWWFSYIYIWFILFGIAMLFSKITHPFIWAVIGGVYGLVFGLLSSFPYFVVGGFEMALAYWVSGIPFDITHSIGNFFSILLLFKPLYNVLNKLELAITSKKSI